MDLKNLSLKKKLGQHFLNNRNVLNDEVRFAKINKNETILEIGPGTGNLTELLAQRAKKVILIEKDLQFTNCLNNLKSKYNNIGIIWGDALEIEFPEFDKVVSNLPFNVALPLTFKLLNCKFKDGILVYQKSLAKRLCAKTGYLGYGRISVQVQRVANFYLLKEIGRKAFSPVPDVDCAIIKIEKVADKFKIPSEEFFKKVLDYCFFKRTNKLEQVLISLRAQSPELKPLYRQIIHQLSPEEFGMIANILYSKKVTIPIISDDVKRKAQKYSKGN